MRTMHGFEQGFKICAGTNKELGNKQRKSQTITKTDTADVVHSRPKGKDAHHN